MSRPIRGKDGAVTIYSMSILPTNSSSGICELAGFWGEHAKNKIKIIGKYFMAISPFCMTIKFDELMMRLKRVDHLLCYGANGIILFRV